MLRLGRTSKVNGILNRKQLSQNTLGFEALIDFGIDIDFQTLITGEEPEGDPVFENAINFETELVFL